MSARTEHADLPAIKLEWSSQRLDLRHGKEDWTGKTDPLERRKLQNRLNQRARRMRTRVSCPDSKGSPLPKKGTTSKSQSGSDQTSSDTSHSVDSLPTRRTISLIKPGCMAATPRVQELMRRFAQHAYMSYMQGTPALSHLSLLVKYNVSSALQRNADILGVTAQYFEWDGISPFSKEGINNEYPSSLEWPVNLLPTRLQCSMEHHPWVDVFPWPKMRDNMLQAFQYPEVCDEDQLCREIVEYGDENSEPLLIVWGDACNPQNWEVTPEFLRKWGWLLNGCEEFLDATNRWRVKRSEVPISTREVREAFQLSIPAILHNAGS